jgi:hypothetical protein
MGGGVGLLPSDLTSSGIEAKGHRGWRRRTIDTTYGGAVVRQKRRRLCHIRQAWLPRCEKKENIDPGYFTAWEKEKIVRGVKQLCLVSACSTLKF